jgi:capsular exopolysaccharide synthesis family protein
MTSSSNQLDLRRYLRVLWRRKWLFLVCVVAIPAAAYAISSSNAKVYQSSVLMQVQGTAVDTTLFQQQQANPNNSSSINVAARLISTTAVAQEAAKHLRPAPANPDSLLGSIAVSPDATTGFITITASAPQPQRAADIATAFSEAIVAVRSQQAVQRVDDAVAQIQAQLDQITDPLGKRQLSSQLQRLRALKAAQGQNATVIEPAQANAVPVSPKPKRALKLSIVIALLIGLGLVGLAEAFDRRVREPEELEEITGLPVLSVIPRLAFTDEGSHAADEAFHTLRASLTFFNIDRTLSSVLVTSPQQGDGKTTVSVNIAKAFARAGKDVVLVDADLRRPAVAKRLGIETEKGLGAVLIGEATLEETIVEIPIEGSEAGRLRVLPAGPPPPNPSELTASQAMRTLLHRLDEDSDLVIVDTNPVLTVADAIPVMKEVSGVLLVCRVDQTTRDGIGRLHNIIETGKGVALGIVATGSQSSGFYGYGYGYGYGYEPDSSGSANGGNGNGANGNGNGNGKSGGRAGRLLRRGKQPTGTA